MREVVVFTRDGREKMVQTELTLGEAIEQLRDDESPFVRSLIRQFFEKGLSVKQQDWLLVIAQEQLEEAGVPEGGYEVVVEQFDRAAEHLKWPKLDLGVLRLKRAGERARMPGSVNILDSNKSFLGRITREGTLQARLDPEQLDLLDEYCSDPEGVAARQGKESGACVYCSRELTDERSLDTGYGPVCAKRYGLAWGVAKKEEDNVAV